MKECDILAGVKTYSDPSYIFWGGQDPQPPRICALIVTFVRYIVDSCGCILCVLSRGKRAAAAAAAAAGDGGASWTDEFTTARRQWRAAVGRPGDPAAGAREQHDVIHDVTHQLRQSTGTVRAQRL